MELRAKVGAADREVRKLGLVGLQGPGPAAHLDSVDECPGTRGAVGERPVSRGETETLAQLQQLAALYASGALTDAEFAAAQAGLLS